MISTSRVRRGEPSGGTAFSRLGGAASQFLARVKENLESWDWAEDLGL
jgi:hypothetical protein